MSKAYNADKDAVVTAVVEFTQRYDLALHRGVLSKVERALLAVTLAAASKK